MIHQIYYHPATADNMHLNTAISHRKQILQNHQRPLLLTLTMNVLILD